jgi:hypothetical protein
MEEDIEYFTCGEAVGEVVVVGEKQRPNDDLEDQPENSQVPKHEQSLTHVVDTI